MMRIAALLLALGLSVSALAVEPGEILPDPALEQRARIISQELRCLVCQNETIDASNAPIARDLRVLVRERLTVGDTDRQVVDYIVARYGDYVLLRPPFKTSTWLLWLGPVAVLLLAGTSAALYLMRRRKAPVEASPLTAEETRRLETLMRSEP